MANTITKTVLIDGRRNIVVHVNVVGDGSGDEAGSLLIDRSTFDPIDGTELVVDRIQGHLTGFSARLLFDATTDLEIAQLPDGQPHRYSWCDAGGFSSNKSGPGANGDILIATTGLGAGERGTFTLFMRKA